MTLLWYCYIFFIYYPFVQLQIIDIITDTTTTLFNNSTIPSLHVAILGALTNVEQIKILNHTTINSNADIRISSQSFILDSNPLITMSKLCEIGDISHAKVIIAGHSSSDDDDNDLTLSAISYVSDFYHLPVITIASRENIYSDKALYEFFVRLIPPYLYEADVWFSIIRKLKYTQVVLIYSQDEESRMVAARFQMLTDDSEIQVRFSLVSKDLRMNGYGTRNESLETKRSTPPMFDAFRSISFIF